MKVFDYTNGTKGELLGNVKMANGSGGWFVVKDGQRYKVELTKAPRGLGNVYWCTDVDNGFGDLIPETFGVGAILICLGEWKAGIGDPEWEWRVVGTTEWNREACRSGILKSTHLGEAFPH